MSLSAFRGLLSRILFRTPCDIQGRLVAQPADDENIDLAYLYAQPLVLGDTALDPINVDADKRILLQCLEETGRRIRVRFEACTPDAMRTIITKKCTALHYSGHGISNGEEKCLSFEDGMGGMHMNFQTDKLKALFQAGNTTGGAIDCCLCLLILCFPL